MLMLTAGTDIRVSGALPEPAIPAPGAYEAIWPAQVEKICMASWFSVKACIKSGLVSGKAIGNHELVHLQPPFQRIGGHYTAGL